MKITVEESKTKRCQEGFASGPVVDLGGRSMMSMAGSSFAYPTSPMFCIGPGCMAWRWSKERTNDGASLGFCGKAHPVG